LGFFMVQHHYLGGDMFSLYTVELPLLTSEKRAELAKSHARMLCEAVAHVHKKGYLHRDIKPENVFVEDGLFLGDFGFARKIEECKDLECEGTLIYMAPEIA
jgi:serine/threonine protein kinase